MVFNIYVCETSVCQVLFFSFWRPCMFHNGAMERKFKEVKVSLRVIYNVANQSKVSVLFEIQQSIS